MPDRSSDAVVIDRPGYLGAIQTFRNAGARLVGWDVTRADTDELEELLLRYRPKLIYTNPTHQNPTGATLPIRTRREMLELAARYRVPIVEDDTYRDLALTGPPPPPSLFALDEAHTVVIRINSFSKMLAPGLRLGWISAVRPIVDQLALIKQQVDPHTQNLSRLVIAELIEQACWTATSPPSRPSTGGGVMRWCRRCGGMCRARSSDSACLMAAYALWCELRRRCRRG